MSNTHDLRRRCPCCRKKRRFHEPPGDQGGTRPPKIGWAKVNNVWQCPMCVEHTAPCRPKKSGDNT